MMLYVMRHARAEDSAPGGDDNDRPLSQIGCDRTREAAAGMLAMGLRFDAILTSPKVRAVETASLISSAYDQQPAPQILRALSDEIPVENAAAALAPYFLHENVLIVGHEPQLGRLASLLLTNGPEALTIQLKRGGCVAIDLPNRTDRAGAKLLWMMTQKHLRKMRKRPKS
jgi:phosphohistidine phosphatase